MFGSSHTLGKPHLGPTWHTHKKCGKVPLGLPTCGSHFDELTLGKLGENVWQNVAMLVLSSTCMVDPSFFYSMVLSHLVAYVATNKLCIYFFNVI